MQNNNKTARITRQSLEWSDCPLSHFEWFLGREINENFNYWTKKSSVKILVVGNWFDRLTILNSIWNNFVVRNNVLAIVQSMAKFKLPEFCKKWSELKYFLIFDFRESNSSKGFNFFCRKLLFRSLKDDWIKNHPKYKYSVFFESRNKNLSILSTNRSHSNGFNEYCQKRLVKTPKNSLKTTPSIYVLSLLSQVGTARA